jgi:hypothetical protein
MTVGTLAQSTPKDVATVKNLIDVIVEQMSIMGKWMNLWRGQESILANSKLNAVLMAFSDCYAIVVYSQFRILK